MFGWIKRLFGSKPEPLVLEDPIKPVKQVKTEAVVKTEKPKKTTAAKPKKTTKKATVDFSTMSKKELLAEAKSRGVPANASLKKEVILERLKSA